MFALKQGAQHLCYEEFFSNEDISVRSTVMLLMTKIAENNLKLQSS
jgi:hypothetical protein